MNRKLYHFLSYFRSAFDGDEEGGGAASVTSSNSAGRASRSQQNPNLIESLSEDGNINISNVKNVVVGRVGNLFGKGIGGLSSKLGSGGWF